MSYSAKVVLVSTSPYIPERDDQFLRDLIAARIELFCVTGVGARAWEDAVESACLGDDGQGEHWFVTISHGNALVAEVVEFANDFPTSAKCRPQVVYR